MDDQQDAHGHSRGLGHRFRIGANRPPRRAATLFRNTLAQSGPLLLGYLLSFILAPILIARLGLSAFGVWAVTGAFATYAGLFDFGVGGSLTRFVALYDARGDDQSIRECVGLGLIVVTFVGVFASIAAVVAAPLVSDQLGVLGSDQMRVVLLSSVAIWTFTSYGYALAAVPIGLRQMVPPNLATMVGAVTNFVFSIAAVIVSSDLVVYALANAAAALLALGPAMVALAYVWQRPYAALPSRGLLREVLGFSVKNQIGHLAHLVNFETDRVVIAILINVRAAAAFEVAARVVTAVQSVAMLATSAMLPTLTAGIAQQGRRFAEELYRAYTLKSAALAFPIFALTAIGAPFLLMAWVGSIPGEGHQVVSYLTLAYTVHITTGVASTISIATGNPGMVAANSVLIAVCNVALTVALAPLFGFWGVVTGTFLALSVGSLIFMARFHRHFGLPARDYLAAVLRPGALAFGLALPLGVFDLFVTAPDSRPQAAAILLALSSVYGLTYWVTASRLGFLPSRLTFRLRGRRGVTPARG
jgi:O-antigen/teichoic acid export membrane protein